MINLLYTLANNIRVEKFLLKKAQRLKSRNKRIDVQQKKYIKKHSKDTLYNVVKKISTKKRPKTQTHLFLCKCYK